MSIHFWSECDVFQGQKQTGTPLAVLPRGMTGYCYADVVARARLKADQPTGWAAALPCQRGKIILQHCKKQHEAPCTPSDHLTIASST